MTNEYKINLEELVKEASKSSIEAAQLSTNQKNSLLIKMADMLESKSGEILSANIKDLEAGKLNGLADSMIDRLKLTEERISALLEEYSEIKKIGRVVLLQYRNIQKIDIDCSFDSKLSIEKVHDLTSQIEQKIRTQFKHAIITIHPEPV